MRIKYRVLAGLMAVGLLLAAGCGQENTPPVETPSAQPTVSVTAKPTEAAPSESIPPEEPPELPVLENPNKPAKAPKEFADGVMPGFSLPLVGGGEFSLPGESGKPSFIHLFTTWCGSCWLEMPHIETLYREMKDEVNFVVIAVGEEEKVVTDEFINPQEYTLTLPVAYSIKGSPFPDYDVQYVPQTFIVDAEGVIAAHFPGPSNTENFRAALASAQAK